MKFFKCDKCGNIVQMINESGMPMSCCGQEMTELIPGITDGDAEKHVPVYFCEGNWVTVIVGVKDHPMAYEHYIEWIVLETSCGSYMKKLKPGSTPKASFLVSPCERIMGAYAYCNIHGLWKS